MATTKVSGNLVKTATITGNNIANGTITTNNISTSVNLGGPKITTITYPGDDTAADTAGGQTVVLTGNGFVTGASVLLDGVAVGSATVTNTTSISFTTPAKSTGSYIVYVVNTDGSTAILVPGIQYSGVPSFTTTAGTLGSAYEYAAVSSTIAATSDSSITYSLYSGSLPDGVTLASNGQLSGTTSAQSGNTTFSFTVRATDAQNQETDRNFSVTINIDAVTWSAPANNATITTYEYATFSNTFVSTSAAGRDVTYSANVLPANVSITGSTVSGTPTTVGNTTSLITATSNTTNRTAVQTLNFVVQQDVVTWSSPANNVTYTWAQNVANTANLAATSAAGKAITFTANSLPTGLAVSGNTITGTPTVAGNSSSLITATAATTNRTAVQTINWVIQLAADAYWKSNVILLSANSTLSSNSFISDGSSSNVTLTVAGDTRPTNFSPYQTGYYSTYFSDNGFYSTGNNGITGVHGIGTDHTIEFWFNPNTQSSTYPNILFGSQGQYQLLLYQNLSAMSLYWNGGSVAGTFPSVLKPSTWYHFAFVKTGSAWVMYLNGKSFASGTRNVIYSPSSDTLWISGRGTDTYYNGYLSNLRLTSTAVYSGNFTPPTEPLTAIAGTQLLMFNHPYLKDLSTNAQTFGAYNTTGTKVSPVHPFTVAAAYRDYGSAYFDNTGDYITASSNSFVFGTGDFTIEMWLYLNSSAAAYSSFFSTNPASTYNGVIMGTDIIGIYTASGGSGASMSPTIPVNTWTHVAMARQGTTVRVFLNGALAGSFTSSMDVNSPSAAIGARYAEGSYPWFGYISDVRVIKGTALYTTAFTPPSSPLTAVSNTTLLTCQYNGDVNNNRFRDKSYNHNSINRTSGNPTQGTLSPYNDNYSVFFNAPTQLDAISTTTGTNLNVTTGNTWTVEMWIYAHSFPTAYATPISVGTAGARQWAILLNSGGNANQMSFYWHNGNDQFVTATLGSALSLNTWHHIAVTGVAGSVSIYLDGSRVGTGTISSINGAQSAVHVGRFMDYGGTYSGGQGFHGYISNVRFVAGTAVYTGTTYTVPTSPLTAIAGTKFLACQSNRFEDVSAYGTTFTTLGYPTVQNYTPFASYTVPVSYSVYFDASGDYLTVPSNTALYMATGDYTAEAWIYKQTSSRAMVFAIAGAGLSVAINASGNIEVCRSLTAIDYTFTAGITNDVWTHIAVSRTGSSLTAYKDGVSLGTQSTSASYGQGICYIGIDANATDVGFLGHISNLRIIKGQGLYTSTFTPSTTPLTATGNTSLLTCQNSSPIDTSSNLFAVTGYGNAQSRKLNPFGTTTVSSNNTYSITSRGGSVYLDGNDYLTIPTGNILNLSSSANWTVEAWIYPTALSGGYQQAIFGSGFSFGPYGSTLYVTNNSAGLLGNGSLTVNQWQHIALTNNGSTMKMFLNGLPVGSYGATSFTSSTTYLGTNSTGGQPYTGYISDFRVTDAVVYSGGFCPGTTPLTPIVRVGSYGYVNDYTSRVLVNGTGAIFDAAQNATLESVGDVKLTSVSPYAGGGVSYRFDGTGDYLLTDSPNPAALAFGSGDFTIEMWVYPSSLPSAGSYVVFYCNRAASSAGDTYRTTLAFKGSTIVYYSVVADRITSGSISAGQWYHVALCRSGTSTKLFINGTQAGSTYTDTTVYNNTAGRPFIGGDGDWGNSAVNGYISDLRITKGVARYTTTFTPPTEPLILK